MTYCGLFTEKDVQYADIDYMDGRRDFSIDPVQFGGLPQLVKDIKSQGIRFVGIIDPAIAVDYDVFERGHNRSVFIQWANSSVLLGNVPYIH